MKEIHQELSALFFNRRASDIVPTPSNLAQLIFDNRKEIYLILSSEYQQTETKVLETEEADEEEDDIEETTTSIDDLLRGILITTDV